MSTDSTTDATTDSTTDALRAALHAYLALDARLVQAEDAVRAARQRAAQARVDLQAPLGEFVALAQHLDDPEGRLVALQAHLRDEPSLCDLITQVGERPAGAAPSGSPAPALDEATVTAGIWLQEHLEGAGWLRLAAIVMAARAHGIDAVHLDLARQDLVAIDARGEGSGIEWRLALDAAFD